MGYIYILTPASGSRRNNGEGGGGEQMMGKRAVKCCLLDVTEPMAFMITYT